MNIGLVFNVREFFEKQGVQAHTVIQREWDKCEASRSYIVIMHQDLHLPIVLRFRLLIYDVFEF
ncbi:hypothetical protein PanWU01x14_281100 [Parasponia andersonii]|uniref:Uncharacterized protein n=1 Tax=Parasponia andersonii TaxID=3476 RepID=A0A2P5B1A9_PARAD|nr:hypothetical protein PanWU01x14_281100 [Parasponia andersonii]